MRKSRTTMAASLAVALIVLMAASAGAAPAEVTRGDLETFSAGSGLAYDIDGHATMVRTASGRTIVTLEARGLTPGETYGAHVHKQECRNGDAGGHYQFDPGLGLIPGAVLFGGASEIWPGPFTANAAGHGRGFAMVEATAGADAVSVVVHAPASQGSVKIACADLR